jgi:two-component system OmpR family sensor kinase
MGEEQAARIFERFYRADGARSRADGGAGLGLAIVAGLVAVHRGTVSVFSTLGGGATFQVRLPLTAGSQSADSAPEVTVSIVEA